jgi:hypothetical protein
VWCWTPSLSRCGWHITSYSMLVLCFLCSVSWYLSTLHRLVYRMMASWHADSCSCEDGDTAKNTVTCLCVAAGQG